MNSYIVTPHEGIGSLKLGMSPEEILAAVQRDLTDLKIVSKRGIQISKREGNRNFGELGTARRCEGFPLWFGCVQHAGRGRYPVYEADRSLHP